MQHEITNIMPEVRRTWYKVTLYWKATDASKNWDAMMRSKLLHGLETPHLTDAMSRKLDVFQLKGFRKILNMETTFINRANSIKRVYEKAS